MTTYGIGIIAFDGDFNDVIAALESEGIGCDIESTPTNVLVSLETVGKAVEIINGLGYETDEDSEEEYEVVVENVGTVYFGDDIREAMRTYRDYVEYVKCTPTSNQVTMFVDHQLEHEFYTYESDTIEDLEEIEAGAPATMHLPSDKYPYTVQAVTYRKDGSIKSVTVREDAAYCYNNERQLYKFAPNPSGKLAEISKRRGGIWYPVGTKRRSGIPFTIGTRKKYIARGV